MADHARDISRTDVIGADALNDKRDIAALAGRTAEFMEVPQ